MNSAFRLSLSCAALCGAATLSANDAAFVALSNLGTIPGLSVPIYDLPNGDNRVGQNVAQGFVTGPLATSLSSVTLSMNSIATDGGGFSVSLYSHNNGPGSLLATLAGDAHPVGPGLYEYAAPDDVVLSPARTYWIVASVPHYEPDTRYFWLAGRGQRTAAEGWSFPVGFFHAGRGQHYFSNDPWPSSWVPVAAGDSLQMEIKVTAVLEPEVAIEALPEGLRITWSTALRNVALQRTDRLQSPEWTALPIETPGEALQPYATGGYFRVIVGD